MDCESSLLEIYNTYHMTSRQEVIYHHVLKLMNHYLFIKLVALGYGVSNNGVCIMKIFNVFTLNIRFYKVMLMS